MNSAARAKLGGKKRYMCKQSHRLRPDGGIRCNFWAWILFPVHFSNILLGCSIHILRLPEIQPDKFSCCSSESRCIYWKSFEREIKMKIERTNGIMEEIRKTFCIIWTIHIDSFAFRQPSKSVFLHQFSSSSVHSWIRFSFFILQLYFPMYFQSISSARVVRIFVDDIKSE